MMDLGVGFKSAALVEAGMVRSDEIRVRAYHLWVAKGRPSDSVLADWLEAERSVFQREGAVGLVEAAVMLEVPAPKPKKAPARGRKKAT